MMIHLFLSDVIHRIQEYCDHFHDHTLFVSTLHDDETASHHHNYTKSHTQQKFVTIQEQIDHNHLSLLVNNQNIWPGDDELPQQCQLLLKQNALSSDDRIKYFLPKEGHFLLDVTLTYVPLSSASAINCHHHVNDNKVGIVQVQITSYRHTLYGMKIIQKIKSQLEGEVCRTNRKWRRKLVHQNDLHQLQGLSNSSTTQNDRISVEQPAMDES
jgi:hypothetical protein